MTTNPQPLLPGLQEIIVDNFAGGGGASLGIEQAIGRPVDIAINHDPEAVALHRANHPDTEHHCEDVWTVNPADACAGRTVGLAWFSPDCKHFSKAKGGKPVSKKVRGLAWVVVKWAKIKRPRIIMLENVEEFEDWGPLKLDDSGSYSPCPERKGHTFRRWVAELQRLGYVIEWRTLRACDYGAPTIRKRLFIIARRDGQPIRWPTPTHAAPDSRHTRTGSRQPWSTAADIIDWTLPSHSIFLTPEQARAVRVHRPLADATLARIARGVQRYVIDQPEPFLVTAHHAGNGFRGQSLTEPFKTVASARDAHGLVAPSIIPIARCNGRVTAHSPTEPLRTITAHPRGGSLALVTAFLAKHYGGGTHVAEARAFLIKYYGAGTGQSLKEPAHTVTARERFGLVTVAGQPYQITDIGMRMLAARELYRAQGFPDSYHIDIQHNGKPLTKSAQVRMAGNSVVPHLL